MRLELRNNKDFWAGMMFFATGACAMIAAIGSFFAGTVCTLIIALFGPSIAVLALPNVPTMIESG